MGDHSILNQNVKVNPFYRILNDFVLWKKKEQKKHPLIANINGCMSRILL